VPRLLIKFIVTAFIISKVNAASLASAGDVYVILKAYTTEDEISEVLKPLNLPWRILQSVHFIAVSADDENDVKVRNILLKQPMVESAYVVIETRTKVNASGTVKYLNMEGGFWGVLGDDKESYDLVNMPNDFKKEGLRIKFSGKPIQAASTRMWGTMVNLESIEVIGGTQLQPPN
jgi:hypothetical protein